jgi:hypothetical protein
MLVSSNVFLFMKLVVYRLQIYEAGEFHGGLSDDSDRLGYDAVTLHERFAMF